MPLNAVLDLSLVPQVKRKASKWEMIRAANRQISPGQAKLIDLIAELQKSTNENEENTSSSPGDFPTRIKFIRQCLTKILHHRKFQYLIISLVLFDLLVILIELILGMFNRISS